MKNFKFFFILLIITFSILASKNALAGGGGCVATGNDNCVDAITLTIDAPCTDGCTDGATTESGELLDCASGNQTIWYQFVATSTNHQVNVWQDASGGCFNGSVVWDGSGGCLPTIPISCQDAANGPIDQAHLLTGLTIGNTYYVQVVYNDFGPCGNYADLCVEVLSYDPCATCSDECYAMCEFATPPTVADVTSSCPSNAYDPPMNEQALVECYTFTAASSTATLEAVILSNCGGGQFTQLALTLYDNRCVLITGPIDIFSNTIYTCLPQCAS